MQMISSNILGQIFKEHNIGVDRISKIRNLQTLLNDITLDIPLMRRAVNMITTYGKNEFRVVKLIDTHRLNLLEETYNDITLKRMLQSLPNSWKYEINLS